MSSNKEVTLDTGDFIDFLDSSLEEIIRQTDLPVKLKNGNFRFQKYLVKKDRETGRYDVVYLPTKQVVSNVFLKTTAFIIVNKHKRSMDYNWVIERDKEFLKNYADCQFYRYTIKNSKEPARRDSALFRFEVSADKARHAKASIDRELRALVR
jgi:hypothetical protein